MKRAVAAILTLIVLSGCASSTPPPPSVYVNPTRGQTPEQQVRDQNDCVQIAKQQTGYDPALDTAKGAGVGAAIGALGGAAAGAAIGAATGSAGTGAAIGAATGAVGGAAVGGGDKYSKSKEGYEQAYATCMSHKGLPGPLSLPGGRTYMLGGGQSVTAEPDGLPDGGERVGEGRPQYRLDEHEVGTRLTRPAHERLVVPRDDDDARSAARAGQDAANHHITGNRGRAGVGQNDVKMVPRTKAPALAPPPRGNHAHPLRGGKG